jgi:hypothetical protein
MARIARVVAPGISYQIPQRGTRGDRHSSAPDGPARKARAESGQGRVDAYGTPGIQPRR